LSGTAGAFVGTNARDEPIPACPSSQQNHLDFGGSTSPPDHFAAKWFALDRLVILIESALSEIERITERQKDIGLLERSF
jgi:hypothetical protein